MKATHTGEPGQDWRLGDGPYVFAGTPRRCLGELTLINESPDKVKVRALDTRSPGRTRKDWKPLSPTRVRLFARLPPHSRRTARAALELPPDTAPGRYQATLACGQQSVRLEVEVEASEELEIGPSHLKVRGASGDRMERRLTLVNSGNLPVDLGKIAIVWLHESDWIGRALIFALRASRDTDNYEDFANRLLHEFRHSLVPPTRIELEPPITGTLAPGTKLERTLKLTLPPGLKKGRRYIGFIRLNDKRVWMELYCSGGERASGGEAG